ncbi:uncharacterized protein MEPE_04587 [Melanopsichium pennsylvanicum]|uniref:BRCT domain-containing protein n=2 Tax=Melanopsichium pennsylvanicum TaxID=63383 RepID=A0AAJ4XPD5_9BASI|nr:conserved hypothetical protein [Melanopsichium pennsylvanicum 4]SNX85878.1 uncharacterized protein MEPE_04587 [Melanopsichium pennsylvanicum]
MASTSSTPHQAARKPVPADLFAGVKYFVNDDVDPATQDEIRSLLSQGGAQHHDEAGTSNSSHVELTHARFRLDSVTHVFAVNVDFLEYQHCNEPTLPEQASTAKRALVVTPQWVLRSAQLGVRLKEDRFSCRSAMIFSGLCVTASKSELSKADRELISSIVSAYGGLWREDHFFDVNVYLTTSTSSSKVNKILNHPSKLTICAAPQWISDSWRLQKLLPLDSYQFLPGQNRLPSCFAGRTAAGAPLTSPRRELVAMSLIGNSKLAFGEGEGKDNEASRDKSDFRGKSVLLARDVCRASEQQLRSLEHFIKTSGGTVRRAPKDLSGIAQAVRNSDFVVCRYREVQEFREAIRQTKQVGNLSWLIWVVSNDLMCDPRDEPLHFPVPRQGILEFQGASITISSYRGTTRQYLTKMIKLMGASFSGTLTARTSLCVAANLASEKTDRAREWKVPVVNHKYIVDSFLAWAPVERAKLKYIDFPEGMDYNLDVGETRVTDESLGPWIDDAIHNDEPEDMPASDPVEPIGGYAAVEPSIAEPAMQKERVQAEASTPPLQLSAENVEPVSTPDNSTGFEGTSPPATPLLQQDISHLHDMSTSSDMPSSPGPSEQAVDHLVLSPLSQRGTKRSRMSVLQDSVRQPTSHELVAGPKDEIAENKVEAKKAKTGRQEIHVVSEDDAVFEASGDARLRVATSNYKLKKTEENKLKSLGIDIVDNIELADILVTPKVSRSPKMLHAIASGRVTIVSPDWLQACLKKREIIAVPLGLGLGSSPYHLVDREGEKTYGIKLAEVVERRKTEFPQGVYHAHSFWLGRGVDENGSFSTLIEAAGGQVLPVPFDEAKLLEDPDHYHLVVDEDHTIEWRDLIGLPTVKEEPLKLYRKQLITDCIFEQQPRWDRHLVDTSKLSSSLGSTPTQRSRAAAGGKRVYGR